MALAGNGPDEVGGIRAEGLPPRGQLRDGEADVGGVSFALTRGLGAVVEAPKDSRGNATGSATGGHQVDDPPGDQFRLAVDAVQVVEGGQLLGDGGHANPPESW